MERESLKKSRSHDDLAKYDALNMNASESRFGWFSFRAKQRENSGEVGMTLFPHPRAHTKFPHHVSLSYVALTWREYFKDKSSVIKDKWKKFGTRTSLV